MATTAASTDPATRPTRNLTLPNEVLTMIVSECHPTDFKSLRLASKLMYQVSTQPFARKKFSRRQFIFTYQSMKALVDITAHPVFGPHLTCLTFGICRMRTSARSHSQYNDELIRYELNEAMHSTFINGGHHIKMLEVALENLQKCRNTGVTLGIHDDVHCGIARRRGYAFDASYQDFHARWADPPGTLWAIISATEQSKYPLTALKLCLSEDFESFRHLIRNNTVAIRKFLPNETSKHKLHADVQINVWRKEGSYAKLKLLSNFTRLELSRHLIGVASGYHTLMLFEERTYGAIWRAIEASQLQSIAIERSDIFFEDLQLLLQSHSRSLKSLELHQCSAVAHGYNRILTFLRFLRYNLNLSYLSIDGFYLEDRFTGEETDLTEFEKFVCEGEREVVEGLDKLIQEYNGEYEEEFEDASE